MYKLEKVVTLEDNETIITIRDNKRFFCSYIEGSFLGIDHLIDSIKYVTYDNDDYCMLYNKIIDLLNNDSTHITYCSTKDLYY